MATGSPDYFPRMITSAKEGEQEQDEVTDAETVLTFSSKVQAWLIYNHGPFNVHINLVTGVDTNAFMIPSGAGLMMDLPTTSVFLICAAGQTAQVYIWGFR